MNVPLPRPAAPQPPIPSASPWLLLNTRSFRASRGLGRRARVIAERYGAGVVEACDPASIVAAIEQLRRQRVALLIILAGDGTVQAAVEHLARLPPGEWRPELMLLGGGRSNVTPKAISRQAPLRALKRALRGCAEHRTFAARDIPLLRIEQAGASERYGFLLVTGIVDQSIRLCRRFRESGNGWRHRGPLSDLYSLIRAAAQTLIGRTPFAPRATLDVLTDAGAALRGSMRFVLLTTLPGRIGPIAPFIIRGRGRLRLTAVAGNARTFWWYVPQLLCGHFSRHMTATRGYLVGRFERIEICGLRGYSLDGEAFDSNASDSLVISPGPSIRFLIP